MLIALKTTHPSWSVRQVIAGAIGSGHLPDGVRLAHSTVHGLLGAVGLMSKPAAANLSPATRWSPACATATWSASILQDRALDGRVIVIRVEDGLVVKRLRRRRSA